MVIRSVRGEFLSFPLLENMEEFVEMFRDQETDIFILLATLMAASTSPTEIEKPVAFSSGGGAAKLLSR